MAQPNKADASEPAQSLEDYFNAHAADIQDYTIVTIAHPIKAGERYQVDHGIFVIEEEAEEDGYVLQSPIGADDGFMTVQDLVEKSFDISNAETPLPKRDVPDDITLIPVGQGETIKLGYLGREQETQAPIDGFVIETPKGTDFLSRYEILSIFNYAGKPAFTHEEQVVGFHHNEPTRGLIVKENTVFDFDGDREEVEKGSVIAEFKVEGQSILGVMSPDAANISLRKQPDAIKPIKPGFVASF